MFKGSLPQTMGMAAKYGRNPSARPARARSCSSIEATLQFNSVKAAAAGTKKVVVEYLSGEVRGAQISVNGGSPLSVQFQSSGGFDVIGKVAVDLPLNAGDNTILFSNPSGWAPDMNAIDVFE